MSRRDIRIHYQGESSVCEFMTVIIICFGLNIPNRNKQRKLLYPSLNLNFSEFVKGWLNAINAVLSGGGGI